MIDKRDLVLKALQRADAIDPKRLLDDEIDTACNALDSIMAVRPNAEPTEADANQAVLLFKQIKVNHARREAERKARREAAKP